MADKVYLKEWTKEGDRVRLLYRDGMVAYVNADDFNRAFGCIVSGEKENIVRDFAVAGD